MIETFLDHVLRQSYAGRITVVVVDDRGEDDGGRAVRALRCEPCGVSGSTRSTSSSIASPRILGTCASRNAGVAAVEADLYVVIDCDCLINRDFVNAHVFEHWFPDVDAVIGAVA